MIIRKASEDDVEGLYTLLLEMFEAEDKAARDVGEFFLPYRERRGDVESSAKAQMLKEIKSPGMLVLAAEDEGTLVGYAFASITEGSEDQYLAMPRTGHVQAVVVAKSARGKGVGKALHDALLSWFRQNGCYASELSVFVTNPARSLYEKWGYSTVIHKMVRKL